MAQPLRVFLFWSVLLTTTSLLLSGCTAFNTANKDTNSEPQEGASEKQMGVPVGMLTSLEVLVDACPVFLEPERSSPTFGPLTRGEVVKRLDARDKWIRLWIPRLRISGWVPQSRVGKIVNTNPNQPPIPEKELTTMIVVSEKINVRGGPTTKSEIILVAGKDDAFFLLGEEEGWCEVWVAEQNRTGWIFGKGLVRKIEK